MTKDEMLNPIRDSLMEGWMKKKGKSYTHYENRYCILFPNGEFEYYKDKELTKRCKPMQIFNFKTGRGKVQKIVDESAKCLLHIHTKDRTWSFQVQDQLDRMKWKTQFESFTKGKSRVNSQEELKIPLISLSEAERRVSHEHDINDQEAQPSTIPIDDATNRKEPLRKDNVAERKRQPSGDLKVEEASKPSSPLISRDEDKKQAADHPPQKGNLKVEEASNPSTSLISQDKDKKQDADQPPQKGGLKIEEASKPSTPLMSQDKDKKHDADQSPQIEKGDLKEEKASKTSTPLISHDETDQSPEKDAIVPKENTPKREEKRVASSKDNVKSPYPFGK